MASSQVLLFTTLLLAFSPSLTLAWGKEGHYITCYIAETLFSRATSKAVRSLLPDYAEGSLADMCAWPDTVRRTKRFYWSGDLHFINTPDFQCNYNYDRDCHNKHGVKGMCISGAINNFTNQLTTFGSSKSQYNLTEALLFLAHALGDIHQPLHVGFTGDLGGNSIHLRWFRRKGNLHHVWDSEIIDTAKARYYEKDLQAFIDDLNLNITNNWDEASKWSLCHGRQIACPDVYAREGIKAACRYAYKDVEPDITLEDDYFLSRLPIVQEKLSQGGVRLAAILNRIFDPKENSK